MRIFILTLALLFSFLKMGVAQCDDLNLLQVINTGGQILFADTECTDAAGWTHYYNSANNRMLISIKKNGQDIGSIDAGMSVQAGTLPGYGAGAFNLSGADYIDDDIWVIANRFWRVTGANAISQPVGIRFYFTTTDVFDIAGAVDDFGFLVDEPDDLLAFTLGNGNGLDPLATETQPFGAVFTLYDMVPGPAPDWTSGDFNGFPYGEFEVATLDIGGSMGFLIFQNGALLAISGNIKKESGTPVEDVTVQAASVSVDVSDANGDYACPDLLSGANYEVTPTKDINHPEYITVADLVAITRHVLGLQPLSSPYQLIAADANNDQLLTFLDVTRIRDVMLGNAPDFPNNTSWRFVPKSYVFPNPANPFTPAFPESITVNDLQDSLFDQDFVGIKTGDVVDDGIIAPPALNTTFSLPNLSACNPGDTVTFSLQVADFQNIRAFQFSLDWDENVMEFLTAKNFMLPNFTAASVGTAGASNGQLTFAWISLVPNGNSVANGTAICQLQFVVSGNIGNATALNFTNAPTDLKLIHQNFSEVTPATSPGSLTIDNSSAIAASASLTLPGCEGEPIGGIDLTVTAGAAPFSYLWSNGATSQDLTGIAGGDYSVTVSDASGGCPMVFFFELPLTSAFDLGGVSFDMTCPYLVDGEIDLEVNGGVAPYAYLWSNGSTKQDPKNLYQGTYTVTVTDAVGCTATTSFTIENPNKIFPVVMVKNASNANASNGAVTISQINGGVPPFQFLWNTGADTQSIQNVPPGDYVVTITDGLGCLHVFGYEVYGLFTSAFEAEGNLTAASLFPNPAQAGEWFNLSLEAVVSGEVAATIFSPEGKIFNREAFQILPGRHERQFAAPGVRGFYFIQIEMDGQLAGWLKLVVQ